MRRGRAVAYGYCAFVGELDGVADKIDDNLFKFTFVGPNFGYRGGKLRDQFYLLFPILPSELRDGFAHQLIERHVGQIEFRSAGFDL